MRSLAQVALRFRSTSWPERRIAWVRFRFLHVSLRSSLIVVTLGGVIVLAIGVLIASA